MSTKDHFRRLTIRRAEPTDEAALARLAQRDSSAVPGGALLVAEEDGQIQAALALASGRTIADPFHPTAELVGLLRTRADQIRRVGHRRPRVIARTVLARNLVRRPA